MSNLKIILTVLCAYGACHAAQAPQLAPFYFFRPGEIVFAQHPGIGKFSICAKVLGPELANFLVIEQADGKQWQLDQSRVRTIEDPDEQSILKKHFDVLQQQYLELNRYANKRVVLDYKR